MPAGGARHGAGRKALHDEIKARDLAVSAIVSKFGSLENGMQFLLETKEPTLIKFVFEHAVGKPREKQDITSDGKKILPQSIDFKIIN